MSFTDDAGHDETLSSAATALVLAAEEEEESQEPPAMPTGLTGTVAHDAVSLTWDDPGDASITGYQILRRNRDTSAAGVFEVHVEDTGSTATSYVDRDVTPETRYNYRVKARNESGLSERSYFVKTDTPSAPAPNSPATGAPAIGGTAQVGETLTADTSGIADADGLAGATFSYQWMIVLGNSSADIPDATDVSYTPIASDEGNTIRVRVSFTDDAGHEETLSSEATASVLAAEEEEESPEPTPDEIIDLGDVTDLGRPQFPMETLGSEAGAMNRYRFELTEAKKVGLGVRNQQANADLFIEDEEGNVLGESRQSGTANEWLTVTVLSGTYYVRVEAQEAGSGEYTFRYGVEAPDPDEVARLEALQDEPPVFGQSSYAFSLAENADGSVNRVPLGVIFAHDPGRGWRRVQPGGRYRRGPVRG